MAIYDDEREIKSLEWGDDDGPYICVGELDVTRIDAVKEPGQMANVTWFEVWHGKHLAAKVRGSAVDRVCYAKGDS